MVIIAVNSAIKFIEKALFIIFVITSYQQAYLYLKFLFSNDIQF
jgi:hypothetical protein